ncbi:bacillithiol biosynthesis deacetylase BshB1 [Paenibacillus sp. GCM10012307]|uniref:Bacillithiol biosynthesis deacetylase BshB1 n=1 Tax=Paenibacillus roseus TaxID=2798579 RepID=A0A934JAD6_9BACL|nr:bacillithiol biosynthesis deacetylase BshB1 [Paenibacillus roseus]MBJ6363561.1 bacillithiol biosynthesis deacetylase BshB1 [Paenibacillus roseus]
MNPVQIDLLAFGAHPDDVEIGMSGTIAKHVAAGFKVGICDLTEAEMSSNGTVELRREEAANASAVLGLSYRSCLKLPDRGLTGSPEQIAAVVAEIRRVKPRIVFAPYWDDRHPDHNACSRLIEEAVFNAKLRRYMPELPAHPIEQLIFYYINDVKDAGLVVDVSPFYPVKRSALSAYRSQFTAPSGGNDQVATPLTQGYLENVEARDRILGASKQMSYAEGFIIKRPLIVDFF